MFGLQPGSYCGGDDDNEMSVSLVEETRAPGGNPQPTASNCCAVCVHVQYVCDMCNVCGRALYLCFCVVCVCGGGMCVCVYVCLRAVRV